MDTPDALDSEQLSHLQHLADLATLSKPESEEEVRRKSAKVLADPRLEKYKLELAQIQGQVGKTIDHVQNLCRQFRGVAKLSKKNLSLDTFRRVERLKKPNNYIEINKLKAFKKGQTMAYNPDEEMPVAPKISVS